jgi:hypothetical protein
MISTRARRAAAESIGDHLRPVSGVAAEMGMDWRIAHNAFVASADEALPDGPPPVRALGIDETRRGKGRYEVELSTGVKVWVWTGSTPAWSIWTAQVGCSSRSTAATRPR